ncbi:hypothetical protein [Micromonospora sp. WMMD964]|uniref:hypothetical protein n=1 Tax=Micromonospora sp. WMMD964 TaxID=3016091 RepID=UPI00249AAB6D|nr:hypothetical protein [Micromonospora sp. WMMD964]WFF00981.1 hypothetical protein O7616_29725 [Micromonospora sp. WMMD964]
MPEPQPGARPADGSTPGAEPDRDPAAADKPTSPPVPSDQPEPSTQPTAADRPESSDQPEATATEDVPAPRWSGSAAVPPPLPRRPAWGESAEPTPPQPVPVGLPEHQTPVDPWAGVDTGGWDLPSAELPPLPPTTPYPVPPATRQWSTPPAPPVGPHQAPPPPPPPPVAGPMMPSRPMSPPAPPPAPPPTPVRPPKQRRGGHTTPPTAPPPGRQVPKGYAPRRRRRRWPWLLLLTLACCCGCPAYYGFPISAQYPARAALPEQVEDLTLRQDNRSAETAKQLENEVRNEHLLAEDTFAGVYSTSSGKRVTVFGGTGFRLTPEADAEAEISRLADRYALDTPETVDTGVRGRHERCAVGRADGGDVVVCTSVDHGSIATAVFTRLSVTDSATLLNTLRSQIVRPERG